MGVSISVMNDSELADNVAEVSLEPALAETLQEVIGFLGCETPTAWLEAAPAHLDLLLIDHAHCEKKAASTALNLMYRYVNRPDLLHKMAQLAREELLHFEQVLEIMASRQIRYDHLSPSRYAQSLRASIRKEEPARLIDTLIVGAFIEARSCERFAALIPYVDQELGKYYRFLLKSESRHFIDYLELAYQYNGDRGPVDQRIIEFRAVENGLILEPDELVRFHSGPLRAGV